MIDSVVEEVAEQGQDEPQEGKGILVGVDGTRRGKLAVKWAANRAQRLGVGLTLMTVIDDGFIKNVGVSAEEALQAATTTLEEMSDEVARDHPGLKLDVCAESGKMVPRFSAASREYAMIVLGSHHGRTVGGVLGGEKGLRVSVSSDSPTAIIPSDFDPEAEAKGVVLALGPDDSGATAALFAAREALATGEPLEIMSAWGLPAALTKPAEVMGGGIKPVGEQFQSMAEQKADELKKAFPDLEVTASAIEGSSPAKTLLEHAQGHRLLVMGTHRRSVASRLVFGSVTEGVMAELCVPLVIVAKDVQLG